ncbi:MAG: glutamate-cysteine ligase family protein [Salinibacter sp.]|uniref:CBS domain-containing protein n=1 Tax=Salinibacter sp. TaxID=2065818 RepID=UPI0035D4974F
MGEQNVQRDVAPSALREFTNHLMRDVRALELMLHEDMFEAGVRRIGAEQELFMVDERGQPAPIIEEVLERNTDDRIVTELTKFNVEFNMDPLQYGGDCFGQMEQATNELIGEVRNLARESGGEVAMTGILPTANLSDFALDYMTPRPRYYALNDALSRLRGGAGQYQIRGIDELFLKHDSIMLEGCNTSFQTHFQVSPEEFPRFYNIAQVVAAPCLAAATNSPLLFGKRLWRETRIALFQQAVDTRSSNLYLREMSPRVHFGTSWVDESVMEIFKEDISRFRVLLTTELNEDPLRVLEDGGVPQLMALQLHNGTVYRWNRACYGITNGKPHLRIENRVLPSGPTVLDEVANAVFWYGLVAGLAQEYEDVSDHIEFYEARYNFNAAARNGLASQFVWLDGSSRPAHELILDTLIPLAERGLRTSDVDSSDINQYLGVIQKRVETRRTGSQWQLDSLARMEDMGSRAERLGALTRAMVERQKEGEPVHEWPLATLEEGYTPTGMKDTNVEDYMTTDLFTVHEEESIEFVARLMDWQKIRHVLVEDEQHRLVGLVSHRSLLRHMAERAERPEGGVPVGDIMVEDPISVSPDRPTLKAVKLMRKHEIGALPVVRENRLVGIITEQDFIQIAGNLLDETLGIDEGPDQEPAAEASSQAEEASAS